MIVYQSVPIQLLCVGGRYYTAEVWVAKQTGLCYHQHLKYPRTWVLTHIRSGCMLIEQVVYTPEQARAWIEALVSTPLEQQKVKWTLSYKRLIELYGEELLRAFLIRTQFDALKAIA